MICNDASVGRATQERMPLYLFVSHLCVALRRLSLVSHCSIPHPQELFMPADAFFAVCTSLLGAPDKNLLGLIARRGPVS